MDKEAKAKIVASFLEEAALAMKARKISKETLLAGMNLYIETWNPPEKPFDFSVDKTFSPAKNNAEPINPIPLRRG